MKREVYKYSKMDNSVDAYDELVGYCGIGKVGQYEDFKERIDKTNNENLKRDGQEEIQVNKHAVLNEVIELEDRKKIEAQDGFIKWLT